MNVLVRVTPLAVFRLRCEARAMLHQVGVLDLHEAVDVLQEYAARSGLVDMIGDEEVQGIMSDAFDCGDCHAELYEAFEPELSKKSASYRLVSRDGVATEAEMQVGYTVALRSYRSKYGLARAVVDTFKYLVRQNDPGRLREWLAKRPRDEAAALTKLMVTK
jgi:hypothetical protein